VTHLLLLLALVAALGTAAIAGFLAFRWRRELVAARQVADLDSLTGLFNQRFFHALLGREVARAQRYGRRLSLIVVDVDDFKSINDRIGHLTGNLVLTEVASRVRAVVRGSDVACRIGGDEFAVIMPESGQEEAQHLADRIRTAVSELPLEHAATLSVSAGVAELSEGEAANDVFVRADKALYDAKKGSDQPRLRNGR